MRRYYFDVIDEHGVTIDDEGLELADLQAVQDEAVQSMADATRNTVVRPSAGSLPQMAIEVRNDAGHVMMIKFSFEIARRHMRQSTCSASRRSHSGKCGSRALPGSSLNAWPALLIRQLIPMRYSRSNNSRWAFGRIIPDRRAFGGVVPQFLKGIGTDCHFFPIIQ